MMSILNKFMLRPNLAKADVSQDLPSKPPRRLVFDPEAASWQYATTSQSGTHPGTLGLPYAALHTMGRIPVIATIIQTRINQIADFARPQPDPYSIGYKIRHRDMKRKPTEADQKVIREITEVIERAGGPYWYGGFEGFLRAVVRDSLMYDQANFEIIRDKGDRIWGFAPVDASTIRRAKPSEESMQSGHIDPDDVAFVQVVGNNIVNEFTREEMAWGIRRPRTWLYANGYGYPEIEELMVTITNILNAETFNAVNFTNGIHTRTILGLKSTMDETMFQAFKREVVAMMSGVGNARRVPIVQLDPEFKEELAAIPLDRSNQEMEYREWLNWLLKVICAGFQMDPAEIGFTFGNEGQSGGLQGSPIGEKVIMSREKGLRPLTRSVCYWLNEWVVQQINPDFMIEFSGFDSESEEARGALDVQAVTNWATIDEIRAHKDMDPLPDKLGEIILNPTWMQAKSAADLAKQQEEQAAQMGGAFSDEDPGGLGEAMGMDDVPPEEEMGAAPQMDQGEPLMASSATRQFGQVEGIISLSDRLDEVYARRLSHLRKMMAKVGDAE